VGRLPRPDPPAVGPDGNLRSVTSPAGSGPTIIAPPKQVAAAGVLICVQAVAVTVLAVLIVISGLKNAAATGQLLAQAAYYVVLAAAMVVCGMGLIKGRRWGRTPTIVVQIVVAAVGYYLAVPSGRVGWGVALIVIAMVTGGLLVTKAANEWISRFPSLFGPEPDR
jgi:hypothetical protein